MIDPPQSDIKFLASHAFARHQLSHMLHDYGDSPREVRRRASHLRSSRFIVIHLTMPHLL
jgi:hypothetical protein